ncbi:MAG TPA: exonuclease SbcCD subunit D [Dehalococcoidia bacterium]|nr:exonuclease SbcCD subunit D [Dehalococcoidia bacterium]
MRLIHTADLHIGVESYGRPDPATGLSSRLTDFLAAFDALVEEALAQQVDAVLFCGDAYKSREPSPTHQREFAKRIARLARGGVAVFLLAGNHDMPNALGRATAIEIFDTLGTEKVTVAQRPDVYRIQTRSGPLQVAALPWPRRGDLLTNEELRGLSPDDIRTKLENFMADKVEDLAARLTPETPTVLAAHVAVSGAEIGSEGRMVVGQDPMLLRGYLQNSAFDYVALGHYHKHQKLAGHPNGLPWVVYSGSLQPVDFGEEGEKKGYCLLTVEPGGAPGQRLTDWAFHPVPTRPFLTLRLTIDEGDLDPTGTVCRTLESQRPNWEGAIVKVVVTLPQTLMPHFNEQAVRRVLGPSDDGAPGAAWHIVSRQAPDDQAVRARLGGQPVESWTTMQALDRYLELNNTDQARRERLLALARQLTAEGAEPTEGEEILRLRSGQASPLRLTGV